MTLPNDKDWHWHECPRCESISDGLLLRRNNVTGTGERPVIVLFQTGTSGLFHTLIADLNQLPFHADDGASECGGTLPRPWAWKDLNPALLKAIRSKGKIFNRR